LDKANNFDLLPEVSGFLFDSKHLGKFGRLWLLALYHQSFNTRLVDVDSVSIVRCENPGTNFAQLPLIVIVDIYPNRLSCVRIAQKHRNIFASEPRSAVEANLMNFAGGALEADSF
jgi:hypothetical protein